ncbi:MAG: hypothetical protein RQ826_06445, partial [Xanthomonadales bacterium]|nr:hypothetical protein [Xanthomonadales bacterium]
MSLNASFEAPFTTACVIAPVLGDGAWETISRFGTPHNVTLPPLPLRELSRCGHGPVDGTHQVLEMRPCRKNLGDWTFVATNDINMTRILLFLATNAAVLVLISVVFQLLGIDGILAKNGVDLNLQALLILSAVIGFVLVVVVRLLFRDDLDMAAAVTWAMLGNFVGIGFAALSDIHING